MRIKRYLTLLLVAVCLPMALPAVAQDTASDNPLLELLGYVPDTETYREFINFGDLARWNAAWGLIRIGSVEQLELRSDLDDPAVPATLFTMTYQTSAPQAVGPQYLMTDDLRGYLGVDLLNTDQFLEAGSPPDVLTVVTSSATDEAVSSALTGSGYTESVLGNATLFSIRDDFEIDMQSDIPMVARLGSLNRVALVDDAVVIARASAITEDAIAAHAGEMPSLAEDPVFRAGALAVSEVDYAGDGVLVGALFMAEAEPMTLEAILGPRATAEQIAALREQLDIGVPAPSYDLAVFATRRRAADTQLLLALVLPPGSDAQAAADTVLMRMKRYDSLVSRQSLLDIFEERGVAIEWGRGVDIDGQSVTLVSLSVRNPTLREGDDGRIETAIFNWQTMVYARDLGFLANFE